VARLPVNFADMNGRAELNALQAACRACHVCVDQGIIPEATPTFAGAWGAPFFLVGQAPGGAVTHDGAAEWPWFD